WGWVAMITGDYERARALCEKGLERARALGDPRTLSAALNNLAGAVGEAGDHARAPALFEESLAIQRELGGARIATALANLGLSRLREGDLERSRRDLEEAVELA